MIDAHNHLHDPRFQGRQDELIAEMKATGITACVVNGTCEADWPEVAALAERHPEFIKPAFGLHPWNVEPRTSHWRTNLSAFLERFPTASLGECGLDRWIKSPDLPAQHQVFREQLSLAQKLRRPVTIHCLKAWGPLLEELKALPERPPFLLHSFGGSSEIAQELLKLGAQFSFSGYFLIERKAKVREVFARLPHDRILAETDAPDMAPPNPCHQIDHHNHPANLTQVVEALSMICNCPPEVFEENTKRFFGLNPDLAHP